MSDLRTSGPLQLSPLESGGFVVAEDWWVESDETKGIDAALDDGTVEQKGGRLHVRKGFRCDGGSFIACETDNAREGYVAHDARYRLSKRGKFGKRWGKERVKSDRLMYRLHRSWGMTWVRAQCQWLAVRVGASDSARPQPDIELTIVTAGR